MGFARQLIILLALSATIATGCGGSAAPTTTATTGSDVPVTTQAVVLPEGSLLALAVLDQPDVVILDAAGREVLRLQTPDGSQLRSLYQPPGSDMAVATTTNGFFFVLDLVDLSIVEGGVAPAARFYPIPGFGEAQGGRFIMEFPEQRAAAIVPVGNRALEGAALAEVAPGQLYLLRMNQPGTAALASTDLGEWLIDFTREPLAGVLLEATAAFTPAGDQLLLVDTEGAVRRTSLAEPFGGTVVAEDAAPPLGLVGDILVHGLQGGGLAVVDDGGGGEMLDTGGDGPIGLVVAPDGSGGLVAVPGGLYHLSADGRFQLIDDVAGFRVAASGSRAVFMTHADGRFAVVAVASGAIVASGDEPTAAFHAASSDGRFVGVQAFAPGRPLSLLIDTERGEVRELAGKVLVSPDGTHVSYLGPSGPVVASLDDPGATSVLGPPGTTWWLDR